MTLLEPDFEKTLRHYVLGSLDEAPRLQLEERLVKDPDAFEALGAVEDQLAEEYLEGELTETERLAYERHHATSSERQRATSFFRALKARASTAAAEPSRVASWSPATWFRPVTLQPVWLGAAAAVLVASLAASAWLALRQESLQGQIARMQAEAGEPATAPAPASSAGVPPPQLAELAATKQELEAQLETERQQRAQAETLVQNLERAARRPATSVPTFALAAGLLRGGGSLARVAIPPDATVVRLALDLPGDDYPLYRATLYDVDGDELWVQSKLKAEATPEQILISLLVPSPLMPHGDYQLKVRGIVDQGEPEGVASYTFRVTRP